MLTMALMGIMTLVQVSLSFKVSEDLDPSKLDRMHNTEHFPQRILLVSGCANDGYGFDAPSRYPKMSKKMGGFKLDIEAVLE